MSAGAMDIGNRSRHVNKILRASQWVANNRSYSASISRCVVPGGGASGICDSRQRPGDSKSQLRFVRFFGPQASVTARRALSPSGTRHAAGGVVGAAALVAAELWRAAPELRHCKNVAALAAGEARLLSRCGAWQRRCGIERVVVSHARSGDQAAGLAGGDDAARRAGERRSLHAARAGGGARECRAEIRRAVRGGGAGGSDG